MGRGRQDTMSNQQDMSTPEKLNTDISFVENDLHNSDDYNLKNDDGKIQVDSEGFVADVENMPKGYYTSPFFLGTCCAVGFGAWAGNAGFAYAAPLLATINADIGPDPNIQWVALIHPVGLSVGMVSAKFVNSASSGAKLILRRLS